MADRSPRAAQIDPANLPGIRRRLWPWGLFVLAVVFLWGRHSAGTSQGVVAQVRGWLGKAGTESKEGAAGAKGGAAPRETPVVAVRAKMGNLDLYLAGLGTVTALNTVNVRSRVDGQVMKVSFTEGQPVQENDPLAELDTRPFEVQLEQAEGQLARDSAQLRNAEVDLVRYRKASDTVTQQQVATQEALVGQLRGTVQIDQALIDNAKLQLVYCHITSPLTGRIGLRQVDVGNIVHANDSTAIAIITQLQPIAVVFTIPQDEIAAVMQRMRAGSELTVQVYNRELKKVLATGTLKAVDNQVDPGTGTVKLKAQFANADGLLFPNQFVNAKLKVDTLKDAILVTSAAVQRGPEGTFCYLVKGDGTVEQRAVTVGPVEADVTAILGGLAAGDVVVTNGADKLTSGAKVAASIPGEKPSEPASGTATPEAGPAGALNQAGEGKHGRKGGARSAAAE